jgi:hypothetical protein
LGEKKEAGKSISHDVLPERPPGLDDEVLVGGGGNYRYHSWSDEDLMAPLPLLNNLKNRSKLYASLM